MKTRDDLLLTRRQAIQGAASLVGGTIATTQIGMVLSRAAIAAEEDAPPVFFDNDQFALLERVVDVMIPETDTPGAHSVGVHYFLDLMLEEWASPNRQARYVQGLQSMGNRLDEIGGEDYLSASTTAQLNALSTLDAGAFADDSGDAFFREFKKLVLFCYYSSEAGATVELQYEALTPDYKACVPIDDIGRAWFWLGFSHGL